MHITYMIRKKFNIVWFDRKKVEKDFFFKIFLKSWKIFIKYFFSECLFLPAPHPHLHFHPHCTLTRTIPAPALAPALCLCTLTILCKLLIIYKKIYWKPHCREDYSVLGRSPAYARTCCTYLWQAKKNFDMLRLLANLLKNQA